MAGGKCLMFHQARASLLLICKVQQSNQDHGASMSAIVDDDTENSTEEESSSDDINDENSEAESVLQRDSLEDTMAINPKTWQQEIT